MGISSVGPVFFRSLILVLLAASPLAASTPVSPSAAKGWRITGFSLEGLENDLAKRLKNGLTLAGQSRWIGTRFPVFFPDLLEADLQRSRLFLARHGYSQAVVDPRLIPDGDQRIKILWRVVPGSPTIIASVTVDGLPPAQQALAEEVEVRAGAVFSDAALERAMSRLEKGLKAKGHARATVTERTEMVALRRVTVRLIANPGPEYRFGKTEVQGVSPDLIPLATGTIDIKSGDRYNPETLARAQNDLRLLSLFRQIRLDTKEASPGTLDVYGELLSRKPRELEFALGYWTDELVRVRSRWRNRNLFRRGRGGEISGSVSRFLQELRGSVWWPSLFMPRTVASLNIGVERQSEDSYDLVDTRAELAGLYRPRFGTSWRTAITFSNVDFSVDTNDPDEFIDQGGLLTILSLYGSHNTADNLLFPARGHAIWFRTEVTVPGGLSESHYLRGEGSAAGYLTLGKNLVLASRLSFGLARPTGGSVDLLPNKRFFAGGATSMRGFRRRGLGPRDSEGDPVGGEAKLELGSEFRVALVGILGGVVFCDAGQVWEKIEAMRPNGLEVAVGGGLMARTPVGAVRAEVGYRLTDQTKDQPDAVFHLTIGHPF